MCILFFPINQFSSASLVGLPVSQNLGGQVEEKAAWTHQKSLPGEFRLVSPWIETSSSGR